MTTAAAYLEFVIATATPSAESRRKASLNRASIDAWLSEDLGILRVFETGSWSHGTAAAPWSDVDYFASMPGSRPNASATDLETLRKSLAVRFPGTWVRVTRPAVAISFAEAPDVELTPAHISWDGDYLIPDPQGNGWIRSNPLKHNEYVNQTRDQVPEAKKFIRLLKEWKYQRRVPISSLYLEMRAAKYLREHKPYLVLWDLAGFFDELHGSGLADMNDPSLFEGRRIIACSSSDKSRAVEAVDIAARASRLARECHLDKNDELARKALEILFEA
ncbi:hypothetical protein HP499_07300 [Paenarthrobacter sp. CM16]|uniref:SMODS domain-containing nucleotidyltransferase n=1 Tax=Paenarthrobacter sp. CM16 TaxID=2738447 RepID=UPI0015532D18|nr:hypothetical protein [Paenarthrobacter sp. CM16]NQD87609.1 hypothetical protein [Paenarthrobacter sp. CM16]